jgi:hypothetical protein
MLGIELMSSERRAALALPEPPHLLSDKWMKEWETLTKRAPRELETEVTAVKNAVVEFANRRLSYMSEAYGDNDRVSGYLRSITSDVSVSRRDYVSRRAQAATKLAECLTVHQEIDTAFRRLELANGRTGQGILNVVRKWIGNDPYRSLKKEIQSSTAQLQKAQSAITKGSDLVTDLEARADRLHEQMGARRSSDGERTVKASGTPEVPNSKEVSIVYEGRARQVDVGSRSRSPQQRPRQPGEPAREKVQVPSRGRGGRQL